MLSVDVFHTGSRLFCQRQTVNGQRPDDKICRQILNRELGIRRGRTSGGSKFNGYKGEKREHLSYSRFMNRVMISEFTISVKILRRWE